MRILSYNIWNGGEDRLARIRDVIHAQAPDAVALLEASDRAHVEWLAGELGMRLVYGEARSAYHIAWLSRLPITQTANHRCDDVLDKTLLEIEVAWHGDPLRLFATHLNPERTETGEERRAAEVRAILDVLRQRAGGVPHAVVGDLNTLAPGATRPPSAGLSNDAKQRVEKLYGVSRRAIPLLLAAGYVDCYHARHPQERGDTFKAWEPVARIDYIFASPELAPRLGACDRVTGGMVALASDHLPVWAEFA